MKRWRLLKSSQPTPSVPIADRVGIDAARATLLASHHRYRAIFISDTHLGTRGCKADYLLDFLRHNESDSLYLVGDVIDGWAMKKGMFWPQSHNDVVQKVLRKARKGTQVVYVPGNHDEFGRQFVGLDFGGIAIREESVHVLADGRRLWVVHGDFADCVIQNAKWLAYVGDSLYTLLLWLNRHLNRWRMRLGLHYCRSRSTSSTRSRMR
jgi:UDP-2,3-diacylglucosamine pyrophosphatase LpxH